MSIVVSRPIAALMSFLLASLGFLASAECVYAQRSRNNAPETEWAPVLSGPAAGEIQVLPVQGNVYVLIGAGGNITVQAGDDGILLVDAGLASMSDEAQRFEIGESKLRINCIDVVNWIYRS